MNRSTAGRRSSARRGRPPRISREDVVTAALGIGVAEVTYSAVAREIGVTPPALYRFFPTRESLVVACVRHAFADIPSPAADTSWRDAVERYAFDIWEVFVRHPGLHEAYSDVPLPPQQLSPAFAAMLRHIEAKGYTANQARFVMVTLLNHTSSAFDMLRRQRRYLSDAGDPSGDDGARISLTHPDGRPVASEAELTDNTRSQWLVDLAFLLDSLERVDPHWPEWRGTFHGSVDQLPATPVED
ncbi:TetR/AcrR family transcriptional regulator [Corynebacterium sp.]|uniref:TetR/AcrR family transcriptional regulator n=1 Tax=Corynebacterium sp. TaxID=1720 RepID=UPI0025BAAA12|nr:TetR/AcrR family transcriptional regulator [Corynebacterium sp.]